MNCPVTGCNNNVEPGANTYIEVELSDKSLKKLVCNDCAELYYDHITHDTQ